ncbi:MAG: DinB family protein [Chloroflexi bacterium]|nr:DinB family protein [Chloroflexota bacterium]
MAYVERDIENHPGALEELRALGFRAVPVTKIGDRVVNGFNPRQLNDALGLGLRIQERPPEVTVPLLGRVLKAVERAVRQMPDDKLDWSAPDRERPMREFTYHIFSVTLNSVRGLSRGQYAAMDDAPGRSFTSFQAVADYGKQSVEEYERWAAAENPRVLARMGPRGSDDRSASERLDVTTGHAVQHLRQLYFVLREFGVEPDQPIQDGEFPPEYVLTILW